MPCGDQYVKLAVNGEKNRLSAHSFGIDGLIERNPILRKGRTLTASLLQRVATGDTRAVAGCIDQYGGLIWSLARRLLIRSTEAEDAVQEVFIELWKKAHLFDSSIGSETTFVAMIARRRLIDRRRRESRRLEGDAISIDEVPIPTAVEPIESELQDEAARAARALGELKPEQRSVLQLAVCEGWSHQLIAERLGLPLGTVKTHVRRGLARIREELGAPHQVSGKEAGP